ncbi:MAG: hypothetical protein QXG01_04325 [Candidatus Bathyarchaeia archaeon]
MERTNAFIVEGNTALLKLTGSLRSRNGIPHALAVGGHQSLVYNSRYRLTSLLTP